MACTANKAPLFRNVAIRGFAAQASTKSKASAGIESSTLQNNVVVASIDSHSPIARVSICFRAGSRFESYDNLGVTHVLRVAAGLSNKSSTSFGLMRNLQQIGSNLSVLSDREVIEYNVVLTRNNLDTGLKYLQDAATRQVFKPWELADLTSAIKGDLARVTSQVRAVDLLHRAAFRSELGNSIFCAKYNVGRISSETLQHYVSTNYRASRAAVVGVGVDHQMLCGYAKSLNLDSGSTTDAVSKIDGGSELRVDKSGQWAHVAVGTQGAGWSNAKEALAFAVLQQVAGSGTYAKRGNVNGALGKVVAGALGNQNYGFKALNASYSDNGLFGFVLSADAKDAGKAIDAAIKALKQGSVSNGDVTRGKEQLKAAILYDLDTDSGLLSDIGAQALLLGNVQGTAEILAAIDGISTSDVNAAAKKVASGKWSIGAVGNLANVPYANQIN